MLLVLILSGRKPHQQQEIRHLKNFDLENLNWKLQLNKNQKLRKKQYYKNTKQVLQILNWY